MKAAACVTAVILALQIGAPSALAQTQGRRLTTLDTLRRFPGYYHLQSVLIRGEFVETDARIRFRAEDRDIDVLFDGGVNATSGAVEVRAVLLDVGRLEPSDPRLSGYTGARDIERWPRPGDELLLKVSAVAPAPPLSGVTVRGLALEPWRYEGQTLTLVGQFRGRNLFGDQPGAPAKSPYDFVLRSGDGAVWITGLRPRGRGFDLSVDARVDTGRWLEVTGVVRRERSLVTLEATRIVTSTARSEVVVEEPTAPAAPPSPVEVVFSSPTAGEQEVASDGVIRLQFSRGLSAASVPTGFLITYVGANAETPIVFRTSYDLATRSVAIRFEQPLTAYRSVRVATTDTLRGFDGAPVVPWSVTFTAGS